MDHCIYFWYLKFKHYIYLCYASTSLRTYWKNHLNLLAANSGHPASHSCKRRGYSTHIRLGAMIQWLWALCVFANCMIHLIPGYHFWSLKILGKQSRVCCCLNNKLCFLFLCSEVFFCPHMFDKSMPCQIICSSVQEEFSYYLNHVTWIHGKSPCFPVREKWCNKIWELHGLKKKHSLLHCCQQLI